MTGAPEGRPAEAEIRALIHEWESREHAIA
jgi:hypothetical protein